MTSETMRNGERLVRRLRSETRKDHARIEAAPDVDTLAASPAAYTSWLARLWGFHVPAEQQLSATLGERRPPLSRLVQADLSALGVDPDSLPRADVPALPSTSYALGVLYVLEGSELGRRLLARQVTRRLGIDCLLARGPLIAGRKAVDGRWRSVRLEIAQRCTDEAAMLTGARWTFGALEEWLCPVLSATR